MCSLEVYGARNLNIFDVFSGCVDDYYYSLVNSFEKKKKKANKEQKQQKMVQFRTKWLLVTAGLVSTLSSFCGGFLMYHEGLRVLEKTVEEVGRADAQAMDREVRRALKTVRQTLLKYQEVTSRFNNFTELADFTKWFLAHTLPEIHNAFVLEGVRLEGLHLTDESKHFSEYIWIDPLKDGSRMFTYAAIPNDPLCGPACSVVYNLSTETGLRETNIFNLTFDGFPHENFAGYLSRDVKPGDSWWSSSQVWFSIDDTPYVYMPRKMLLPPMEAGFFKDMSLVFSVELSTYPIEEFMVQYNTDAEMMVTHLNNGINSNLVAANFPAGQLDPNCKQDFDFSIIGDVERCMKTLAHIDPSQAEVAIALNNSLDWKFERHAGYFTLRSEVFTASKFDAASSLYLIWLRSTQKIKDEMSSALHLFIGFLAGIIVFDILMGAAEIYLVAKPVIALAIATQSLQTMDLDCAERSLIVKDKVVAIYEIEQLRFGLAFAVQRLREYKSFLPTTLFAETDSSESASESGNQSKMSPSTGMSSRTHSKSARVIGKNLTSLGLNNSKHAGVLVDILSDSPSVVRKVPAVEVLTFFEHESKNTRGQLHGFTSLCFNTFFITWGGASRNELALRFCFLIKQMPQITKSIAMSSSSKWMAGNIGTKTYRGFSLQGIVTENLLKSLAFSSYAARLGEQTIIIPASSASELSSVGIAVPVGQVRHLEKVTRVSEMVKLKGCDSGEWMYHCDQPDEEEMTLESKDFDINKFKPTTGLQGKLLELSSKTQVEDSMDIFSINLAPDGYICRE